MLREEVNDSMSMKMVKFLRSRHWWVPRGRCCWQVNMKWMKVYLLHSKLKLSSFEIDEADRGSWCLNADDDFGSPEVDGGDHYREEDAAEKWRPAIVKWEKIYLLHPKLKFLSILSITLTGRFEHRLVYTIGVDRNLQRLQMLLQVLLYSESKIL